MQCRTNCGACCIAITISSALPGLPHGKAADLACPHLTDDKKCKIFGSPERPQVCDDLKPSLEMCGQTFDEAMEYLTALELATTPINGR